MKEIPKYIIKDTFIIPFNRKIICPIFGHIWIQKNDKKCQGMQNFEDEFHVICSKCSKFKTKDQRRNNKLKYLLKK